MATIRQQRVATTVATRRMVLKGLRAGELGHLKRRQVEIRRHKRKRAGAAGQPFPLNYLRSPVVMEPDLAFLLTTSSIACAAVQLRPTGTAISR
jgi:hypothetical protein